MSNYKIFINVIYIESIKYQVFDSFVTVVTDDLSVDLKLSQLIYCITTVYSFNQLLDRWNLGRYGTSVYFQDEVSDSFMRMVDYYYWWAVWIPIYMKK